MDILHNISLEPYNTFGIRVDAANFAEVRDRKDVRMLFQSASILPAPESTENMLILGGGSNILFTSDYPGLVIKISLKGIEIVEEDDETVVIKAAAGENWDDLVEYCVRNGYGGIENLSGIPGSVGASPIQNIGAYGTEIKDCFEFLEAYELETGEVQTMGREDCRFGYRDSVFKHEAKGRYLILSVAFRLNKKPALNLTYRTLKDKISGDTTLAPTIGTIRDAVLEIRRSKLPDPSLIGNAGSFFKNPLVGREKLASLLKEYPGLVYFEAAEGDYKIAAGWLIEKSGWKGYRIGDAGVHKDQALVLVNYGHASGRQIVDLAMKVRDSVFKKFGIHLEPEVKII